MESWHLVFNCSTVSACYIYISYQIKKKKLKMMNIWREMLYIS